MSLNSPPLPALEGAVRLADWGVFRAMGEDTRKFLHGQLTQDVEHLEAGHARLAGYCSPKGRLLATFVMWQRGKDEVLLACSADVLPAVLKRLHDGDTDRQGQSGKSFQAAWKFPQHGKRQARFRRGHPVPATTPASGSLPIGGNHRTAGCSLRGIVHEQRIGRLAFSQRDDIDTPGRLTQ